MKSFGFSAKEKLKSRKQIGRVFQEGRHINLPSLRISWILEPGNSGEPLQAGVGASSRHFKHAVDRNRIKRLLREAWRLQKQPLRTKLATHQQHMAVFLIYTGKDLPTYDDVYPRVGEAIEKLINFIHEKPVALP